MKHAVERVCNTYGRVTPAMLHNECAHARDHEQRCQFHHLTVRRVKCELLSSRCRRKITTAPVPRKPTRSMVTAILAGAAALPPITVRCTSRCLIAIQADVMQLACHGSNASPACGVTSSAALTGACIASASAIPKPRW